MFVATAQHQFPGLNGYGYDFDRRSFVDARGNAVTRDDILSEVRQAVPGSLHIGSRGAAAAVFLDAVARAQSSTRPRLLAQVFDQSAQLVGEGGLAPLFNTEAHPDTAIPGRILFSPASKLSVKDVLKGKLTDFKPILLGAIPMNYLGDYAKKGMDAVQQYIDQRYAMATMQGDADTPRATLTKIIAFNAANPAFAITTDTVKRSLKARGRNEALSQGGIMISRRLQALANQRTEASGQ